MRFFAALFLLLAPVAHVQALNVLIDPGHGGIDKGAVRNNLNEADIALNVSLALHQLLKDHGDFQSQLTRSDSTGLSLQERSEIASQVSPDLFISIHVNASEDRRASGAEFYFQNQLAPSEEMLLIAKTENQIAQNLDTQTNTDPSKKGDILSIIEDLKRQQRLYKSLHLAKSLKSSWNPKQVDHNSVKQAPFFVLSHTQSPAILVELGFISNPQDYKFLSDPNENQRMAQKLFQGILKYKQMMDKSGSSSLH